MTCCDGCRRCSIAARSRRPATRSGAWYPSISSASPVSPTTARICASTSAGSRPTIGAPAIEWAQRLDTTREALAAAYPRGAHRVCSDTRLSTSPLELAVAEVGILSTISVPIGDPLQGIVGFGFRASEMLRDEHLPLFRQIAAMLLDRLDWSLLPRTRRDSAPSPRQCRWVRSCWRATAPSRRSTRKRRACSVATRGSCAADRSASSSARPTAGGSAGASMRRPARRRRSCTRPTARAAVNAQLVAVARDQAQPHLYGPLFLVDQRAARTLPRHGLFVRRRESLHLYQSRRRARARLHARRDLRDARLDRAQRRAVAA